MMLLLVAGQTAFGQENDARALTNAHSFDFLSYAGVGLKIGTAITAFFGALKALSEWTAYGRKKRAMEKVIRLAGFINAANQIPNVDPLSSEVRDARDNALKDLTETMAECYPPDIPPSRIRRFLLFYLPPRWVAYVPHFFFFSLWAFAGAWLYAVWTDDSGDIGTKDLLGVLLLIGCFILFMQRWAAVEWRRKKGDILAPSRLKFGLHWYHANSFLGLVSNSLLILNAVALLLMPLIDSMTSNSHPYMVDALPNWQRIVMVIIGAPSFLIAYFWSQSEFLIASRAIRQLTLREIAQRARDFRFPERPAGALVLFLLTIWCLVLIFDVKYLGRIAAFPDGSVGTVGFGEAWFTFSLVFLLNGAVPWIAIYRGLPMLFTNVSLCPEGRNIETD
jgi:hypothetical protein